MANTKVVGATLTKPQLAELKAEAERLGISVPELLRRIVDEWRQNRMSK